MRKTAMLILILLCFSIAIIGTTEAYSKSVFLKTGKTVSAFSVNRNIIKIFDYKIEIPIISIPIS